MAGDLAGGLPENNDWVHTLKDLEASHIALLFDGFCSHCLPLLKSRLLSISNEKQACDPSNADSWRFPSSETSTPLARVSTNHQPSSHEKTPSNESVDSKKQGRTSADKSSSPSPVNGKPQVRNLFSPSVSPSSGNNGPSVTVSTGSSEEEEEWRRFSQVGRKKNFVLNERVNGRMINVLQGLELHTGVFSPEEQKKVVQSVYDYQSMGRKGQLMERTYSEPRKWMRGKGRVAIQFGCCYNYAVDKDGNPPGIIRDEQVDPLPPVFKQMIKRMVSWHVLPPTCVPNSCIVNIYDEGDCIPPHIDHHDFVRPFCTVSFLTECNILFGSNLKVSGPGEFSGPVSIPLPVGSVLVLKGNGADVAKHCVPAVPGKRISVTFRRMDESKIPYNFSPDPELLNLKPLVRASPGIKSGTTAQDQHQHQNQNQVNQIHGNNRQRNPREAVDRSFVLETNDFPPLGGMKL